MANQQTDLVAALQAVVDQARFQVLGDTQVTAATLREMYETGFEGLVGMRGFNLTVSIDDANPVLRTFVDALRASVRDLLDDSGCIGDGLVVLMGGGKLYPPIEEYAKSLLRPAATLGASTVIEMLYGWMERDPVRFKRQYALGNGVSGDPTPTIGVSDGVEVSALPTSSQTLYRRFPSLHGAVDARELMGKVLLTVDWISDVPGIFRSGSREPWKKYPVTPGFDPDHFCEAMSLAMNESVRWHFAWGDYGVLREFNPVGASGGARTMIGWSSAQIPLCEEKLRQAMTISELRASADGRRLETAIYRWNRSKEPVHAFSNKLIELRIALEALYAWDGGPEVTFRQATRGALHLGRTYEERRDYRELLTKVYRLASGAAHGSDKGPTEAQRTLLAEGLEACRKGILKCLAEGGDIDFDKLMFGDRLPAGQ